MNVLTSSISSGAMDRAPASGVSVIPRGKAVTGTYFYNLGCGCVCRASWVPEVGEGGPGSEVLILELSASIQQKADYGDVADKEGVVQRASGTLSDACRTFGKRIRTFRTLQMADLDRHHFPKADEQLRGDRI